jgi:DNA-binding winged helix-turn-helix (wHTH) protein
MSGDRYTFGDVTVEVAERRVVRAGQALSLAPKAFDVLAHLVRRAGHLVSKRELLEAIWPDAFVEEGIVSVHVSSTVIPASSILPSRRNGTRCVPTRGSTSV